MIRPLLALAALMVALPAAAACPEPAAPCDAAADGVALVANGRAATVVSDSADPGVVRAARDLAGDLAKVAASAPSFATALPANADAVVIVGMIGSGGIVDRLLATGRIDASGAAGQWEGFVVQSVERPAPGIARALVIAGADKRGAIFGAYDLSRRAGVSPWTWWADVPVRPRTSLVAAPGRRVDAPKVKYRGIFLNDEAPALDGWAKATFGGYNARFYERVFELTLRLRGNFLWPAMWGKSLWDDDPASAALADRMGVVLGTSHHEPMVRAHVEWERHGTGPWDYTRNKTALQRFWRDGIRRMGANETLVTVGMRGDGDEPMTQGTATTLLEGIVADQRRIIAAETGRPAADTPQVWALYKEVQDYYDAGMRVPDDVTLLFADDNWGNIRRLPEPGATRAGGYGVYYHFDYVGGPRNYKWINTTQIERVWEQMHRAYAHGADRLWITNVGDLKPMEFPTSFFLDLAWNPDAVSLEQLSDYPRRWASEQFGAEHAPAIGALLSGYTRLLARRKPELMSPDTFDLPSGEADRVVAEWAALEREAARVGAALGPEQRDAYFQLVEHPILAGANLTRLYVTVGRNRLHATQGRADTNALAAEAQALFARDRDLRRRYEEEIAGGKWTQMMAQTHIGYTGWQQPDADVMPAVRTIALPAAAAMGVDVPGGTLPVQRPGDRPQAVTVYNKGAAPLDVAATSTAPWLRVAVPPAPIVTEAAVAWSIDWAQVPAGATSAELVFEGAGGQTRVTVPVDPTPLPTGGFVERDGVVAIEAHHFAGTTAAAGTRWDVVPNLGRTAAALVSLPMTAPSTPPGTGASVSYPVVLTQGGPLTLTLFASPSLDVGGTGRLRVAVSIDDGAPQVIDLLAGEDERRWGQAVADNVRTGTARLDAAAGHHVLRVWRVDPGVVVQRLVLARGPLPASYLGPVESDWR